MNLILLEAAGLAAFVVAFVRAPRDFREDGHVSVRTVVSLFLAFALLTISVLVGAYRSVWPLPLPAAVSAISGVIVAGLGASIYVAARLRLRSFRATWGLALDRLVMDGPYRLSRNPQTTGAVAVLLGAALLGRSGAALLLVVMYTTACVMWIRLEEQVLERRFGSQYLQYRSSVPRFL
jgi:protein-S-isoprenylcysteine O-methyltransferase Ste14